MTYRRIQRRRKYKKIEYLENEKSFSNGIKSIFHNFLRAIITFQGLKKKKLQT